MAFIVMFLRELNHSLGALPNKTSDRCRVAILRDTSHTEADCLHSSNNRAGNHFVGEQIVFAHSFHLENSLIVLSHCRIREALSEVYLNLYRSIQFITPSDFQ